MNRRMHFHLGGMILATALLVSCTAASTPEATTLPTIELPTNTAEPSETPTAIPPTKTPKPPKASDNETESAITSTPISEWNNILIMEGAYDTHDDGSSISFSIRASVEDVYVHYVRAMEELGYSIMADSEGGKGRITMFEKSGVLITFGIAPNPVDESISIVVITK